VDRGLQLVFGACTACTVVGLVLTYFFVDDTPHDSLTTVSDELELEAEVEMKKGQHNLNV